MIVKTAEGRRDGRQQYSYKDLISYIAGGGDKEKTLYANCRNIVPGREKPDAIISEMEACGSGNKNAQKKVYHAVISWREGEVPTKEQVEEAVSIYLEELGMDECQCYYGMHQNTNNIHVHVCVNKIDPETHRSVKPANGFYKKANERAARRIELAQGWEVLQRGAHYEVIDGEIYEKGTKKVVPSLSTKAKDFENNTGVKSAERVAQELCGEILFNAKDWQSLHKELAEVGCRLERKGSGAVLFVGKTPVKLSKVSQKLSLKKLEKKLGEFEEPKEKLEVKEVKEQSLSGTKSSSEYIEERRKYYREKDAARDELNEKFRKEFRDLKEKQRKEREELYNSRSSWKGLGAELNAMRSQLAWKQLQEKKAWIESKKERRKELNKLFNHTFPRYTQWLKSKNRKKEADQWRYRESMQGFLLGEWENYVDVSKMHDVYTKQIIESVGANGKRTKSYAYRDSETDTLSFIDRGKRIDIFAWQDEQKLKDALELAQQKWGGAQLSGSEEYIARCIDVAVKNGIKITNPELQERIKERKEAIEMKKQYFKQQEEKAREDGRAKRISIIEEKLVLYDKAVGADRYRITATYTGQDGRPRAFVFDKDKSKESSMPSQGYSFEELKKEIWRIDKENMKGRNLYITPISEKMSHILVDDLSAESLKRMIKDGYKPAAIFESSPGNYQAVINVYKLHAKHDSDIANQLMKKLNNEYGDKNIQGAVHPHRVAGTHNQKPKHRKEDGRQPVVNLIYCAPERVFCEKAKSDAVHILEDLQKQEKARRESIDRLARQNRANNRNGGSITAYEAYMTHVKDIMAHRSDAKSNLSVVDSMAAIRMRVTGWSVAQIESAIAAGAKDIRSEGEKHKHVWADYAKRTAQYTDTHNGLRDIASYQTKKNIWLKLEGRGEERGLER